MNRILQLTRNNSQLELRLMAFILIGNHESFSPCICEHESSLLIIHTFCCQWLLFTYSLFFTGESIWSMMMTEVWLTRSTSWRPWTRSKCWGRKLRCWIVTLGEIDIHAKISTKPRSKVQRDICTNNLPSRKLKLVQAFLVHSRYQALWLSTSMMNLP